MSFGSLEVASIPRTQDYTTMKQNEDNKGAFQQMKEKGKNEYAGNGGKHRKKENSEKDGVVVTKQHQGFDIKI